MICSGTAPEAKFFDTLMVAIRASTGAPRTFVSKLMFVPRPVTCSPVVGPAKSLWRTLSNVNGGGRPRLPHPSDMEADVLRDQRQAEPRPLPAAAALSGRRAPEEPLEDGLALLRGHPRPLVVDRHPGHVVAGVDDHPGRPAAVAGGVLHQVGDDPLHPPLVGLDG